MKLWILILIVISNIYGELTICRAQVFHVNCCSLPAVSHSLRPHGVQHARYPCALLSPGVCPRSYSLYQWCHPAISFSDALFSFCSQSFPGTFPMSHLFASDDQNTGASASASVLQVNIQCWLVWSYCSRDFQESSPAPKFKVINSLAFCLLYSPALTTVHDHWEDYSLDSMDLGQQSNVSAFQHTVCHHFPSKKQSSSDFMAAVTVLRDFGAQEEEICHSFYLFRFYLSSSNGARCFWTVVLEKALESPLDCKEIRPVHSKGDRTWVFFGRNDAKAETPVLWPPHAKSWLIGKDPDAGRDWEQEEKGMTEDEMVGWHHQLDGRESEWTSGVGDGQGGLACCDSWGRRVGHDWVTELNWMGPDAMILIFFNI